MKTERRHELETNELADRLGKSLDAIKPYSTAITLGTIGVLVLIVVVVLYNQYAYKQSAAAWESLYLATSGMDNDDEKLQATIKKHPGSTAADWALLTEADEGLRQGLGAAMTDHKKSREYLNQAVARYKQLADGASRELIRQQALFNMAIAQEALGQVEEAATTFGRVKGALASVAQDRAKRLEDSKDVKEFYDWFAQAELPSRTPPSGRGIPGHRPDFSVDDPLDSPFSLPANIEDTNTNPGGPGGVELPSFSDEPTDAGRPAEGAPPEPPADEPADDDRYATPPADASTPNDGTDDPADNVPNEDAAPAADPTESEDTPVDTPADEPSADTPGAEDAPAAEDAAASEPESEQP